MTDSKEEKEKIREEAIALSDEREKKRERNETDNEEYEKWIHPLALAALKEAEEKYHDAINYMMEDYIKSHPAINEWYDAGYPFLSDIGKVVVEGKTITFYVDAEKGTNWFNPGTSINKPLKTIKKALKKYKKLDAEIVTIKLLSDFHKGPIKINAKKGETIIIAGCDSRGRIPFP